MPACRAHRKKALESICSDYTARLFARSSMFINYMKLPALIVFTLSPNRQSLQSLSQAFGSGGAVPGLRPTTRELSIPCADAQFADFG
jgi:hypothetical protein